MDKENEYLSPTLDVIFKMMFGDENNKDMLKSLLITYLEIDDIGEFELINAEVPPEDTDGKLMRLDLRVTSQGQEIDVEVQVYRDSEYAERCVSYWSSIHNAAIKRGMDYTTKKVMSLNILGFKQFDDDGGYISNFVWYDPINKRQLSNKAKITFVELPKVKNCTPEQIKNDDKVAWAAFFNAKSKEEFAMLNQNTANQNVQKAVTIIRKLSADEEVREIARKREEAVYTEISKMRAKYNEGMEKGLQKGVQKGIKIMADNLRALGVSEEQIREAIRLYEGKETPEANGTEALEN